MNNEVTIHQLFENYVAIAPDDIAVIEQKKTYCYRELNQKANQLASYLLSLQIPPETFIAIAIPRSFELLVAILGTLKAGLAYLPLDKTHPQQRLAYMLAETKAPILLTQEKYELKNKIVHQPIEIVLLEEIFARHPQRDLHSLNTTTRSANQLAYAIYTSGSTGRPKGVLIEHKSVVNYIKWFAHYTTSSPQKRIDFSSNVIFDMAVTSTLAACTQGLQICICKDDIKKNVSTYLQYLHQHKINIIKLTPSYFKLLIEEIKNKPIALDDLQTIVLGGELLLTKDCKEWLDRYPHHFLFNEYGPTESTVGVTQFKITQQNVSQLASKVPIGKPGFNIHCKLLEDHHQNDGNGRIGELGISGISLARGYLNQAEMTGKYFIHDQEGMTRFYRTGDLCRLLEDGNIEFIGRIDEQVKIRGYRIEPHEIAYALSHHPLVKAADVIVEINPSSEKKLIAYYIAKDESNCPQSQELRMYLQSKLPDYMVPSTFIAVQSFALNDNDKLDKRALPALRLHHSEQHSPRHSEDKRGSQNNLEQQLIKIWQSAFKHEKIDVDSNFFELGGHSLTAANIITQIEETFAKKIFLTDIYQAPILRELAKTIARSKTIPKKDTLQELTDKNDHDKLIPLSDFQFVFWISNLFESKLKHLNIISRRRFSGKLDSEALSFAFESVLKKHHVLCYQSSPIFPAQYLKKIHDFKVNEIDLSAMSSVEKENRLAQSMDQILNQRRWKKNTPKIVAKLFYLGEEVSELQISVPHMVFDDVSEDILFNELSRAYLHYKNEGRETHDSWTTSSVQYQDYIVYERNHLNKNVENDISFWQQYLKDATLITLPRAQVIEQMNNLSYSTYLEVENNLLNIIQQICRQAKVTITDIWCATVALSLKKLSPLPDNKKIYLNIIRSTRENTIYNELIGCFLRLDPVKVDISSHMNLIELAKSIQQSRMLTEPHQALSGMVKLACLNKNYQQKVIFNFIIKTLMTLYCKLFRKLKLNPNILKMYAHLRPLRTKQQFLIDINLLHNYIAPHENKKLFGLDLKKTKLHQYNLSKMDNILDICISRNNELDKIYLIISGNLTESFRNELGKEMINNVMLGMKLEKSMN